ncbi:MAG TPA: hypothetical protein DIC53_05820, partial [Synergistaceae bacterium]|nr:hypothetical protein [Synergistaceae bacterium]
MPRAASSSHGPNPFSRRSRRTVFPALRSPSATALDARSVLPVPVKKKISTARSSMDDHPPRSISASPTGRHDPSIEYNTDNGAECAGGGPRTAQVFSAARGTGPAPFGFDESERRGVMTMKSVAFVGIGGVGGYYGAMVARRCTEEGEGRVVFVARGEHLSAIRERGLQVYAADEEFTVRPT